jgi:hypothetical protein
MISFHGSGRAGHAKKNIEQAKKRIPQHSFLYHQPQRDRDLSILPILHRAKDNRLHAREMEIRAAPNRSLGLDNPKGPEKTPAPNKNNPSHMNNPAGSMMRWKIFPSLGSVLSNLVPSGPGRPLCGCSLPPRLAAAAGGNFGRDPNRLGFAGPRQVTSYRRCALKRR